MRIRPLPILALAALAAGCADRELPSEVLPGPALSLLAQEADPPPELAGQLRAVSLGSESFDLWPFTGKDLSGEPSDPVNVLITGEADPANVRSALLALDGDRSALGFPVAPPFDCAWRDAAGGLQTSWASGQWTGSVIQLECGEYVGLRFHLRLFPAGGFTLANAHFATVIPGTTDHQVLSWDLAKQLVQADLARTGLLDPEAPFGVVPGLTPSDTFREIPVQIYDELPDGLRALIGGPLGPVTEPVGIPNNGIAVVANMAGRAAPAAGTERHDFTIAFEQMVPNPVCATSTADWIYATGPVRFVQRVTANAQGEVNAQIQVVGDLSVTPMDPTTGTPIGPTRKARVADHYSSSSMGPGGRISATQLRLVTSAFDAGPTQREQVRLRVGPHGLADHDRAVNCGS